MYRIQVYNLRTQHYEIYKIMSWEFQEFTAQFKDNPNYGPVSAEYIARY